MSISKPDVAKLIALNTGHIFADTLRLLRCDAIPGVISYQKNDASSHEEYGAFVYIQEDWMNQDVPPDLAACIEYAKKHDADWIMFDYDVEPTDDLTFWGTPADAPNKEKTVKCANQNIPIGCRGGLT